MANSLGNVIRQVYGNHGKSIVKSIFLSTQGLDIHYKLFFLRITSKNCFNIPTTKPTYNPSHENTINLLIFETSFVFQLVSGLKPPTKSKRIRATEP